MSIILLTLVHFLDVLLCEQVLGLSQDGAKLSNTPQRSQDSFHTSLLLSTNNSIANVDIDECKHQCKTHLSTTERKEYCYTRCEDYDSFCTTKKAVDHCVDSYEDQEPKTKKIFDQNAWKAMCNTLCEQDEFPTWVVVLVTILTVIVIICVFLWINFKNGNLKRWVEAYLTCLVCLFKKRDDDYQEAFTKDEEGAN